MAPDRSSAPPRCEITGTSTAEEPDRLSRRGSRLPLDQDERKRTRNSAKPGDGRPRHDQEAPQMRSNVRPEPKRGATPETGDVRAPVQQSDRAIIPTVEHTPPISWKPCGTLPYDSREVVTHLIPLATDLHACSPGGPVTIDRDALWRRCAALTSATSEEEPLSGTVEHQVRVVPQKRGMSYIV
jgi:hypothetical protein